jgi:hypothetical protein
MLGVIVLFEQVAHFVVVVVVLPYLDLQSIHLGFF